jgi:hypothetical protein
MGGRRSICCLIKPLVDVRGGKLAGFGLVDKLTFGEIYRGFLWSSERKFSFAIVLNIFLTLFAFRISPSSSLIILFPKREPQQLIFSHIRRNF